ncbi:hypothetical protein [Streptomyces sp. NPDC090025]|uniref:hypothetical protein n=1 Tax=Streptomyces sp. NPDC090025 TaxID=3365922 RepID=UPI0038386343
MDEQPQHGRADETVGVDLGALLAALVEPVEEHAEQQVERHLASATKLEKHHPGDVAVAHLVDTLITDCQSLADGISLIPEEQRPRRGTAAAKVWTDLAERGPDSGPLGTWSYARHLAQAARDMLTAIREHRTAEHPASFVGRAAMPPVRADLR